MKVQKKVEKKNIREKHQNHIGNGLAQKKTDEHEKSFSSGAIKSNRRLHGMKNAGLIFVILK